MVGVCGWWVVGCVLCLGLDLTTWCTIASVEYCLAFKTCYERLTDWMNACMKEWVVERMNICSFGSLRCKFSLFLHCTLHYAALMYSFLGVRVNWSPVTSALIPAPVPHKFGCWVLVVA